MRVIALVGAMGAGKTSLSEAIMEKLGDDWQSFGIDDYDGNWALLAEKVAHLETNAVVESVLMPPNYLRALGKHDATVVQVVCSDSERRRRLTNRGDVTYRVMRVRSHCKVDTTYGVEKAAGQIVQMAVTPRLRKL